MKKPFLTIGRVVLTLLIVTFAVVVVWRMVMYYMFAPWTRDGHIRADIVQIAPDVSGLIQRVDVRDNQLVTKGQVLFAVDQDRFKLALRQAQAAVADRQETLAQAQREYKRNRGLGNLVPSEQLEESQSRVARAQSALAEAQVTVDSAQLNLDRSVIRSPVDGYVNDRAPRAIGHRVHHVDGLADAGADVGLAGARGDDLEELWADGAAVLVDGVAVLVLLLGSARAHGRRRSGGGRAHIARAGRCRC